MALPFRMTCLDLYGSAQTNIDVPGSGLRLKSAGFAWPTRGGDSACEPFAVAAELKWANVTVAIIHHHRDGFVARQSDDAQSSHLTSLAQPVRQHVREGSMKAMAAMLRKQTVSK